MELFWLDKFAQSWLDRERHERLPHAVLLAGAPGLGKRAAAAWLASRKLGIDPDAALPQHPLDIPEHADLQWVAIPEDKRTIGIEQIREIVSNLGLTSYEGRGKVAVIDPANAMTISSEMIQQRWRERVDNRG